MVSVRTYELVWNACTLLLHWIMVIVRHHGGTQSHPTLTAPCYDISGIQKDMSLF